MKKKILFSIAVVAVSAILLDFNHAQGNVSGGPSYCSGSPFDGGDCSDCHGSAGSASASITSNIPASGYVPNTTYTITATATYAGLVKYGFEISPQTAGGTVIGTMTAGTGTRVVSATYITHTAAGTTGTTGSHTWTFTWKAPVAGTGAFTFYGSFNCTNNDGTNSGDHVKNATLAVTEHQSGVGIAEAGIKPVINIFPNPASDVMTLEYTLSKTSSVSAAMYDLQGKEVGKLFSETEKGAGTYKSVVDVNDYKPGVYFVSINDGATTTIQKVMIVH